MCVFLSFRYYKKFSIPDMERADLLLNQDNISIAHSNNTLIVTVSMGNGLFPLKMFLVLKLSKTTCGVQTLTREAFPKICDFS